MSALTREGARAFEIKANQRKRCNTAYCDVSYGFDFRKIEQRSREFMDPDEIKVVGKESITPGPLFSRF